MANLVVYKGDDTEGTFGRHLTITIQAPSGTSFAGCKATFSVLGITKTWSTIASGVPLCLFYTHDETASMPVGAHYGTFKIIDANGNVRTLDDSVSLVVTNDLNQVYPGTGNATISGATVIRWTDVLGRPDFTDADPDATTTADIVIRMQEAENAL